VSLSLKRLKQTKTVCLENFACTPPLVIQSLQLCILDIIKVQMKKKTLMGILKMQMEILKMQRWKTVGLKKNRLENAGPTLTGWNTQDQKLQ